MKLYARERLAPHADATEMFNSSVVERGTPVKYKSRDRLISMRIEDFLRLAHSGHDVQKEKGINKLIRTNTRFETLPYLYFDLDSDGQAKVTGHEGRHRARALMQLGYKTMPVELRGPIRWSEQNSPQNQYDYQPKWPTILRGEEHGFIPFPVSRSESGLPYKVMP